MAFKKAIYDNFTTILRQFLRQFYDNFTALAAALKPLEAQGIQVLGQGLYRVVHANDRANAIAEALKSKGFSVRIIAGGRLVIAPPLDMTEDSLALLRKTIEEIS